MRQILMIGWDGATFDLIRPWVAEGKLPTIARLMEEGLFGQLRSTVPHWTFPAWTSFMTGKNPGKHGIFDFFRPRPGSYNLEFVNGGDRKASTFWKLLSDAGRRVVSISLPCTYPPERVNGVMISGFDFPGEGPGSFVDARGMHPPELFDELNKAVGPHPIDTAVMKDINRGRPDLALEKMLETIRRKAATAKYLIKNRRWDCFMILFGESDGAGHQFWKYCDPKSPLFVDEPSVRDALLRVYVELDRQVAELLALAPKNTTLLMMSDHGFGGVSNWVLYPNRWLEKLNVLQFHGRWQLGLSRLRERIKHLGAANLPAGIQRVLYRFCGKGLGKFEASVRYGMIDWSRTEAFFDENPYCPALRVNLRGRQPNGIVEPGQHYEIVRDRLINSLLEWRHPLSAAPIVKAAYRREEIYSGPYLDQAPDIVVQWAECEGYSYAYRLSSKSRPGQWIEQVDASRPDQMPFFTGKSGTHRQEGIFLAWGDAVRASGEVKGTRIIDLAPTILHLLGVDPPADMDGRALRELFREFSEVPDIDFDTRAAIACGIGDKAGAYTDDEESVVCARLKDLGYVE